jgi:hypothetical protein
MSGGSGGGPPYTVGAGGEGGSPVDAAPPADVAPDRRDTAMPDRGALAVPPDAAPDLASGCLLPPAADEIISTFEGNQVTTAMVAGRGGTSWTFLPADGAGSVAAASVAENCGSQSALRVTGSGFTTRSPLAQALLMTGDASGARFYDATAYKGVRFWLRLAVPGPVRLKVSDKDTSKPGGVCTVCNDHFAVDVDATTDWKSFTVPWTALKQLASGDKFPALDLAHLFGIEFFPAHPSGSFDLWVDDVTFFR